MSQYLYILTNNQFRITRNCPSGQLFGHYVYEWLDGPHIFYVGSGTDDRAWDTHNEQAQERRYQSNCFRVIIRKDRLTKTMAHREEKELIISRRAAGFTLLQRNSYVKAKA